MTSRTFVLVLCLLVSLFCWSETYIVTSQSMLNVRESPSSSSGVITQLSPGSLINVVSHEDGWAVVELESGGSGYVSAKYISFHDIDGQNAESFDFGFLSNGDVWIETFYDLGESKIFSSSSWMVIGVVAMIAGLLICLLTLWFADKYEFPAQLLMSVGSIALLGGNFILFSGQNSWWNESGGGYIPGLIAYGVLMIAAEYFMVKCAKWTNGMVGSKSSFPSKFLVYGSLVPAAATAMCISFGWQFANLVCLTYVAGLFGCGIYILAKGFSYYEKPAGIVGAIWYIVGGTLLMASLAAYLTTALAAIIVLVLFWAFAPKGGEESSVDSGGLNSYRVYDENGHGYDLTQVSKNSLSHYRDQYGNDWTHDSRGFHR